MGTALSAAAVWESHPHWDKRFTSSPPEGRFDAIDAALVGDAKQSIDFASY